MGKPFSCARETHPAIGTTAPGYPAVSYTHLGNIYLLDGLTGSLVSTLKVEGNIEGSPAVYMDTMVVGTTGKNTSYIYGITLQ